jgi:hypothetical protein
MAAWWWVLGLGSVAPDLDRLGGPAADLSSGGAGTILAILAVPILAVGVLALAAIQGLDRRRRASLDGEIERDLVELLSDEALAREARWTVMQSRRHRGQPPRTRGET